MCPFQLEADLASQVGGAVKSIRGSGRDSFLVTVYSKNHSDKIRCIKQIPGNNCQVSDDILKNNFKGLVFIQNYHISHISSFTAGIDEQCRVKEVVEATWVKPRRETTQVFLISFKSDKRPEFVRIPGEAMRTRVYKYKDKPMMWRK